MPDRMSIADGAHILVTSFDPAGRTTATVERVAQIADTRIGWWAPDATGLAERFAASPVVTVRSCASSGRVDVADPVFEGHVEVQAEGTAFEEMKQAIMDKYGFGAAVSDFLEKAREAFSHKTPEAVVLINVVG